jgi:hypothetical protein
VNGRKTEIHHNTPEQVRAVLSGALELVEALPVPDDLRAVAFTKAADLLASKTVQVEQVQPVGHLMAPRVGL